MLFPIIACESTVTSVKFLIKEATSSYMGLLWSVHKKIKHKKYKKIKKIEVVKKEKSVALLFFILLISKRSILNLSGW